MAVCIIVTKYLRQRDSVRLGSGPLLELLISSELKSRPVAPNGTLEPWRRRRVSNTVPKCGRDRHWTACKAARTGGAHRRLRYSHVAARSAGCVLMTAAELRK